jgi:hypothetical protein
LARRLVVPALRDALNIRQDSARGDTDCLGAFRSTLFAPERSAMTSPVHKVAYLQNYSRFPSTLGSSIFWRIALGGGISMTPARRNCRARSRSRIGYSTPFIDSSFPVGIEPFEWGAELRLGDWGVGCCGGDVLERSRARRPPLGSAASSRTGDSASCIEHEQMHGASLLRVRGIFFSKPLDESQ